MTARALLADPLRAGEPKPRAICGAKTRSGGKCKGKPMRNGRCRMHSGGAPSGPASHMWKHGRYSRVFKREWREAVEDLLADPEILSLNDNIRLVDVELQRVIAAVQEADKAADWEAAREQVTAAIAAVRQNDQVTLGTALAKLAQLTHAGGGLRRARAELRDLHQQRRKLVATEARRLEANRAAISIDRAVALMLMLVDIMFRHVDDPKQRRAIIADVRALELVPGQPAGGRIPSSEVTI